MGVTVMNCTHGVSAKVTESDNSISYVDSCTPDGCKCLCHGWGWHYGECRKIVGPRGGVTIVQERWRRNGATKTWKTRPGHFRIPITYGYSRGQLYGYLTHENAHEFHRASDCPLITP
jgi:hypothetical protein